MKDTMQNEKYRIELENFKNKTGLNQEQIGALLGVSGGTISNWLSKRHAVKKYAVDKIISYYKADGTLNKQKIEVELELISLSKAFNNFVEVVKQGADPDARVPVFKKMYNEFTDEVCLLLEKKE